MSRTTTVVAAREVPEKLVRAAAARHGGHPSSTGDRGVVLFEASIDAVRAAIEIAEDAALTGSDVPRIGIAVGETDGERANWTMAPAVSLAAQLSDAAGPGQILVDGVVALLVASRPGIAIVSVAGPNCPNGHEVLWERPTHARTEVIVADDSVLVRAGIVRLLSQEGFDVVGETGDAEALLTMVDAQRPGLVITDIRMPPTNTDDGLRAAATIRLHHPSIAVLVVSQYVDARAAGDLFDHKAAGLGYVLKERIADLDAFADTCRRVVAGDRVIDAVVAEHLLTIQRAGDPLDRLTKRERDVLRLMAQGRANAAIAVELHMSGKTLEAHVRSIFNKLDLTDSPDEHRRVAAVVRWLRPFDPQGPGLH